MTPNPSHRKPNTGTHLPQLLSLDEIEGSHLPLVGGKAFRLAQLKQHGFNVPPGLVLTTHFFKAQLVHARLTPLWTGSPDVAVNQESLAWLADALKTKPLAPQLTQALNRQLERLFGPEADSFAVRSSSIDEDYQDRTFAGIHLTELGVPRAVLAIAITRCWASAFSGPAIKYRQAHAMSIQSIKTAILIQPMLTPNSAGVGFTLNPLTGNRDELVIEATWGAGSALMAGNIRPHLYRLANQPPTYPLLEHQPGNAAAPPNAPQPAQGPLLPPERAALAHQFEQVQALMGQPQDIEWARQNNRFFLLQTRPITVIPQSKPQPENEWIRLNRPEALPELPSPLAGALLEQAQGQIIHFLQTLGLSVEGLGPYYKIIMGRPYRNLTLLKRGLVQVGINPESFLQTMGYLESTQTNPVFSIDWATAWRARAIYLRALKQILGINRYVTQTQAAITEIINNLMPPAAGSPQLLHQFRQQDKIYRALLVTDLGLALAIALVNGLCSRLLTPLTATPAATANSLALSRLKPGPDSLQVALISMGEFAAQTPPIKSHFEETDNLDPNALAAQLPPQFTQAFDHLLKTHGHRAPHLLDPGCPRYREQPGRLLQIIRQYAKSNRPHKSSENMAQSDFFDTSGSLWRRWLARPLIGLLGRLLKLHHQFEETKAQAVAACRTWSLDLAQTWVAHGWLARPEDIFWLTPPEIERTLMIEAHGAVRLSSTVQARKDSYQSYAQTNMPFLLQESQLSAIQLGLANLSDAPADIIIGRPVSPGQAQGTVVVVHNAPHQVTEQITSETILVLPSTDPAWLALLNLAAGLIVETGGLLSHGSIIAREYGLPAVANVPQATQRLTTGDRVLVDGSTGIIQLLETRRRTA